MPEASSAIDPAFLRAEPPLLPEVSEPDYAHCDVVGPFGEQIVLVSVVDAVVGRPWEPGDVPAPRGTRRSSAAGSCSARRSAPTSG